MRIVLGALLLGEAYLGVSWVARLVPVLTIYDSTTHALVVARALVSAMLGTAGWMLWRRALPSAVLARSALLASALLLALELGGGLAPSSLFPAYKWPVVAAYWAYAGAAVVWLRRGTL